MSDELRKVALRNIDMIAAALQVKGRPATEDPVMLIVATVAQAQATLCVADELALLRRANRDGSAVSP